MKKIIDGIRYDTSSARLIGMAESTSPQSDFRYWREALYTGQRSGRFFLHGAGGPMSQWGKSQEDNTRTSGEGIRPLSPEQALAWCENCLDDPAQWENHFKAAITDA
jgi:hypothetical protein